MFNKNTNIDFQDIFFLIWDKYSSKVYINHKDIDIDTILYAFEKALYKFIYTVLGKESIIFWNTNYIPVVYLLNTDTYNNFFLNEFSFNFNIKTYNLFLKMFETELRKQILISSLKITMEDFLNNLVVATIAEKHRNRLIAIIDDIYNRQNRHIAGILEFKDQPPKERDFYDEGKKLFFFIKNVKNRNVLLTRSNKKLVSALIKNQIAKTIKHFQIVKKRKPVLACIKRVPNVYSIVISELRIPKTVLDLTSKNLFKENIYVIDFYTVLQQKRSTAKKI